MEEHTVGFEVIDGEHRIQVGLIDAMHDAVRQGRDRSEIDEILERLLDYSKVHFLSEQLLMRLHAYPDHEDHVQDHERMVEAMAELRRAHGEGRYELTLERMDALRRTLVAHIRTRDGLLGRHLAGSRIGA